MIPAALRALRRDYPAAAARVDRWHAVGGVLLAYDCDDRHVATVIVERGLWGWQASVLTVTP